MYPLIIHQFNQHTLLFLTPLTSSHSFSNISLWSRSFTTHVSWESQDITAWMCVQTHDPVLVDLQWHNSALSMIILILVSMYRNSSCSKYIVRTINVITSNVSLLTRGIVITYLSRSPSLISKLNETLLRGKQQWYFRGRRGCCAWEQQSTGWGVTG